MLANLLEFCLPLNPQDRALAIENSEELESVYNIAANLGDSTAPNSAEEEVDFHYVCFVKCHENGHVYELDGDRKGPIDKGPLLEPDEDILATKGISLMKDFIQHGKCDSINFNLMALVSK